MTGIQRRMPTDSDLRDLDRLGVLDADTCKRRRVSRAELARLYGVSPQRVRAVLGPLNRRRRGFEVTLRVDAATPATVRAIAARHGCISNSGSSAGQGSANALLDAIAVGEIALVMNHPPLIRHRLETKSMTVRLPLDATAELLQVAVACGIPVAPDGYGYIALLLDAIAQDQFVLKNTRKRR